MLLKKPVFNIGAFIGKNIVIDFKKFKSLITKHKVIEVTDIISKETIDNIKFGLYNIKCISLLSFGKKQLTVNKKIGGVSPKTSTSPSKTSISPSNTPIILPKIPGVNGVIYYDVLKGKIEGTSLETIMFIGEAHGRHYHCTDNYLDLYKKLIVDISKISKPIDIFYEQDPTKENVIGLYKGSGWLNKLRALLHPYTYNHNQKKSLLRVHWTDPINKYEPNLLANLMSMIYTYIELNEEFDEEFDEIYTTEKKTELKEQWFKSNNLLFTHIKSENDLIQIILLNPKIIKQAIQSILSETYIGFIKNILDAVLLSKKKSNKNYEWYFHGIFYTQRITLDFYTFFRMLRKKEYTTKLIIKNVIFHAGSEHIFNIETMFNNLKIEINTMKSILAYNVVNNIKLEDAYKECLQFSFDLFTNEAIKSPNPIYPDASNVHISNTPVEIGKITDAPTNRSPTHVSPTNRSPTKRSPTKRSPLADDNIPLVYDNTLKN